MKIIVQHISNYWEASLDTSYFYSYGNTLTQAVANLFKTITDTIEAVEKFPLKDGSLTEDWLRKTFLIKEK